MLWTAFVVSNSLVQQRHDTKKGEKNEATNAEEQENIPEDAVREKYPSEEVAKGGTKPSAGLSRSRVDKANPKRLLHEDGRRSSE